jgi:hypothetical protein
VGSLILTSSACGEGRGFSGVESVVGGRDSVKVTRPSFWGPFNEIFMARGPSPMVAPRMSIGDVSWRWRLLIEIGVPLRSGGFEAARRARRAIREMPIRRRAMMIERKMMGARGIRETILLDVDS